MRQRPIITVMRREITRRAIEEEARCHEAVAHGHSQTAYEHSQRVHEHTHGSSRGFAGMDEDERTEIARKGGRALQEYGGDTNGMRKKLLK